MNTVTVSFSITDGEFKQFPKTPIDSDLATMAIGSTVEVEHSSRRWTGTYEVVNRETDEGGNILYSLILTRVELWHTSDNHYKRWIGEVKGTNAGASVICQWGRIDRGLQSVTKMFNNKKEASTFLRDKMEQKLNKGYHLK